ncbi:hypothetical protein CDEST_00022 [Colletotrichum destructivum]|uniref:Uncharacterized protein n=1 Tax=Colletotrichum destructivum TaxID=34406 RepID=A0AAX4HW71_9PEZI|nr:hypothetical protein CDEST_00022 [Colletotrichum destructivum]
MTTSGPDRSRHLCSVQQHRVRISRREGTFARRGQSICPMTNGLIWKDVPYDCIGDMTAFSLSSHPLSILPRRPNLTQLPNFRDT